MTWISQLQRPSTWTLQGASISFTLQHDSFIFIHYPHSLSRILKNRMTSYWRDWFLQCCIKQLKSTPAAALFKCYLDPNNRVLGRLVCSLLTLCIWVWKYQRILCTFNWLPTPAELWETHKGKRGKKAKWWTTSEWNTLWL